MRLPGSLKLHVALQTKNLYNEIIHGVRTRLQPQGISGTGETMDMYTGKVGAVQSFVNNFKIVGTGPGNNYMVQENFHVTVNANGTVTAYVDNFSVECRPAAYP